MDLICILLLIFMFASMISFWINMEVDNGYLALVSFVVFIIVAVAFFNYGPSSKYSKSYQLTKNVDYKLSEQAKISNEGLLFSLYIKDSSYDNFELKLSADIETNKQIRQAKLPNTEFYLMRNVTNWGGGEDAVYMKVTENGRIYWDKIKEVSDKNQNLNNTNN